MSFTVSPVSFSNRAATSCMANWRSEAAATVISRPTHNWEMKPTIKTATRLRLPTFIHFLLRFMMDCVRISARNKLRGKIEEIQLGDIMAHVVVRAGDNLIESAITRRSSDELKLKKGDTVAAVVKATEVMI